MNLSLPRLVLLLSLCIFWGFSEPLCLGQESRPPSAGNLMVEGATVAFTPGVAPLNLIKKELSQAQSSVDVALFRFTHEGLINALCYLAAEKKVKVRVFINRDAQRLQDGADLPEDDSDVAAVQPSYESIYQKLVRNGVRVYVHHAEGKLHTRCAVIDGKTVISGSCNWWPASLRTSLRT